MCVEFLDACHSNVVVREWLCADFRSLLLLCVLRGDELLTLGEEMCYWHWLRVIHCN